MYLPRPTEVKPKNSRKQTTKNQIEFYESVRMTLGEEAEKFPTRLPKTRKAASKAIKKIVEYRERKPTEEVYRRMERQRSSIRRVRLRG